MHAHELAEQVAALVLLGVGLYVLPASWLARRKAPTGPVAAGQPAARFDPTTIDSAARALAATLALGAAVIHLALTPAHLHDSLPYGLAFAAVAAVQVAIAALALSGRLVRVRRPAFLITAAIIGAWLVSRIFGLPLGPAHWQPEPVGLADAMATGFEAGLLAVLILVTPARLCRIPGSRMRQVASVAIIPVVGILGTVALLVAVSVSAGSSDGHDHSAAREPGLGVGIARAPVPAQ